MSSPSGELTTLWALSAGLQPNEKQDGKSAGKGP